MVVGVVLAMPLPLRRWRAHGRSCCTSHASIAVQSRRSLTIWPQWTVMKTLPTTKRWNGNKVTKTATEVAKTTSYIANTVEPLNKGHFGASHIVLCREVVLFSEVHNMLVLWEWYFEECTLQRGRPFLGGSFIGGSTVLPIVTTLLCQLEHVMSPKWS